MRTRLPLLVVLSLFITGPLSAQSFFSNLDLVAKVSNVIYSDGEYHGPDWDYDYTQDYLFVNLGEFNRYDFGASLDFYPRANDNDMYLLTLSSDWRVFSIRLFDGFIFIDTNNGDYSHSYNTGIRYNTEQWQNLKFRYNKRTLYINDEVLTDVEVDMSNGDNIISCINFSNGIVFDGYIRNFKVYNTPYFNDLNLVKVLYDEIDSDGEYHGPDWDYDYAQDYLFVDVEDFNRYHWGISLDFNPRHHTDRMYLLTLSTDWRVFSIKLLNGVIFIETNNGRHSYNTGIEYNTEEWQTLNIYYDYGTVYINDKTKSNVIVNMSDGNNIISCVNFSNGIVFNGSIRNFKVYN